MIKARISNILVLIVKLIDYIQSVVAKTSYNMCYKVMRPLVPTKTEDDYVYFVRGFRTMLFLGLILCFACIYSLIYSLT